MPHDLAESDLRLAIGEKLIPITAVYLQRNLPFETAVFTHYSNLDKTLRQETEQGFAQASTAICVCTSTLELGIDIGSVEDVILIGPPPTLTSFL